MQHLAVAETWESGRPVRETLTADLPLAVDQWRACAGAVRAQQGGVTEIDRTTVAYHLREPRGVVGLRVGWDFPLLMASWQLAPALAAGNTVVLTADAQTPASLHVLLGLVHDLLPAGVVNIVNGVAERALAAATDLVPATVGLGGRSPNIFFSDALLSDDDFQQKALEGFAMFALNQGDAGVRLCGALIEKPIYEEFLELATIQTKAIQQGNPLDTETMVGAQPSAEQLAKTLSCIENLRAAGARVVVGGERAELPGGFYVQPTVFDAGADIRPFRVDSCGPVVTVGSFTGFDHAVRIANDLFLTAVARHCGPVTSIGLTWPAGDCGPAGRVWTNCYHRYPAHAALAGRQAHGADARPPRFLSRTNNPRTSWSAIPPCHRDDFGGRAGHSRSRESVAPVAVPIAQPVALVRAGETAAWAVCAAGAGSGIVIPVARVRAATPGAVGVALAAGHSIRGLRDFRGGDGWVWTYPGEEFPDVRAKVGFLPGGAESLNQHVLRVIESTQHAWMRGEVPAEDGLIV
nr:aldehyde dehydrogenase family protein [Fodinicola feengrottensis]